MFTNYIPARNLLAAAEEFLSNVKGKTLLGPSINQLAKAVNVVRKEMKITEIHNNEIEAARKKYADRDDRDIEIDDSPAVAVGKRGVYVQAWIYIPKTKKGGKK